MASQLPKRAVSDDTERAAVDALSRAYQASLTRYFAKRVKETHEVEDLVQEVFIRLVKCEKVTDLDRVGGYIFRTASNVLKDWLRYRRTRHADDHDHIGSDETLGAAGFSPERVLIGKAQLARATVALTELPEKTRTIFVLHRIENLRYKEISARLKIPIRTIERHVAKAVEHLTARLKDE